MKEEIKKCVIDYIKNMKTYCINCKRNTANKNSSVSKTK